MYKFVTIGIVSVLLLWIFLVVPELKSDLKQFEGTIEQRGLDQIVAKYGGELSEPFVIEEVTNFSVTAEKNGVVEITASVVGSNLEKNEIIFEFTDVFTVDSKTHKNSDESLGYFDLPFNVQKQEYKVYNPLVTVPTTFVFEEESEIYGLDVYHFSCDSYNNDFTEAYPQFISKIVHIDYECDVWIEPITGNVVDYTSSWDAYFVENGVRTFPVELGGKENSLTSILAFLEFTKNEIDTIYFYEVTLSVVIGIIGLLFISGLAIRIGFEKQRKFKEQSKKLVEAEKTLEEKSKAYQEEKLKLIGTLTSVLIHDIKNPLSILTNESVILQNNLKNKLDKKTERSFTRLDSAINRILDQTESVMNFIKEKQIDIQKNDLSEIVGEAVNTTDIPSTIKLNLDISKQEIECDKTLMINVFSNLLKNAVDATKNGEIFIQIIDKGTFVEINVKDTGSGILEDDIQKIFEYFSTTKQAGTGIGLAECKTTVEMHDGSIHVKNNVGPGVTFTVLLPKRQSKSFGVS